MSGPVESSSRQRQRLNLMRQTVTVLEELLENLFPAEPPNPDVITLQDFLRRYRLTGLGSPAVQAIEQTQRINRTLHNYRQMGLSEFHIGLFYLHWGECQGGIKQFAKARQQWSFVDAAASICLAHFAEGRAHHLAYEYEVAMQHYSKAARWLARIQFTPPSGNQDDFVRQMTDDLQEWQARLRDDMLPDFSIEEPAAAEVEEEPPAPANGASTEESEESTAPALEVVPAAAVHPPISNLSADPDQPDTPVPAHKKVHDRYVWYEVSTEDENFLPEVVQGSWVLVNTDTAHHNFKQDELIVVLTNENTKGSIVLKPRAPGLPFQRITFLGSSRFEGAFTRATATGKVALSPNSEQPVNLAEILGIVVGLWLPLSR